MSQENVNVLPLDDSSATMTSAIGKYRWIICGLLFFATTINYIDRAVLGILEPTLAKEFGWTKEQYGYVNSAFQLTYGLGLLISGWFIDKVGVKLGYTVGVIFWSLSSMSHSLARSVFGLTIARGALGLGESVNFPCAIKAVADWFPKKERALATGIFNAGSNVGLTITPLLVPYLAITFGWRSAFVMTGMFGFIWLFFWLLIYRSAEKHPKLTKAELAYIRQDPEESLEKVKWRNVVFKRQTVAFAVGKFMTDPAWWFFLFWLPPILKDRFGLDLKTFGPPLFVIYVMADFGSILGGWYSSHLLKKGRSVNYSRKLAMFICAMCVVPICFAATTTNLWLAVVLIGLAAGAHQGWSCNLFTLVSDTFPRRAVGSVVGIGGLMGSLGGAAFQPYAGHLRDVTGNYSIPLYLISGVYLVTLLFIHLLMPKMKPAELS